MAISAGSLGHQDPNVKAVSGLAGEGGSMPVGMATLHRELHETRLLRP